MIGYLVNSVFNIEDFFFVEIQYDLMVFCIVRYVVIGIYFFNGEFQCLGDQIVY